MKILFAIQGTGNGHLSRARDIYPELTKYGTVDVLISGTQADVAVPFPVKYRRHGLSFVFGKRGGIAIWSTIKQLKLLRLVKDIRSLPVKDYDLVINDFEPVAAWACKRNKVPCISLSHQCAVLHPMAPKPKRRDLVGRLVLQRYAPVTAAYGFHFKAFDAHTFTPVIRSEIRDLEPVDNGHYTVYLPAYSDETIVWHLSRFPGVKWHVFSKHNKQPFTAGNISVMKIDNRAFATSMEACAGVLCGAGFEGPAEAMYLGKKLLVVPMVAQYEQQCNAVAAAGMGATGIAALNERHYDTIGKWIEEGKPIHAAYPDNTADIISLIVQNHAPEQTKGIGSRLVYVYSHVCRLAMFATDVLIAIYP